MDVKRPDVTGDEPLASARGAVTIRSPSLRRPCYSVAVLLWSRGAISKRGRPGRARQPKEKDNDEMVQGRAVPLT